MNLSVVSITIMPSVAVVHYADVSRLIVCFHDSNLESQLALMMVGFNAMQPSITAQSQLYMAKLQQQFLEEQNTIVKQSTAKLLMAQEELTNEAIKAKEELMARTSSGGTDARIMGLLDEVAALSEELLVAG
jgi:hypothetical protein